ncbi:MAG: type II toxin-antitoxin system VapC family toxin [Pirellulales bacterium]
MYLLDTDHISIIQRQTGPEYASLHARIGAHDALDIYVSIISFHEQATGWNAYLKRARKPEAVVRAYEMFQRILADFSMAAVAPFDVRAEDKFRSLRQTGIRIGTMDLRIASIALCNDWTLLTRNRVDFESISGLRIEDWTR